MKIHIIKLLSIFLLISFFFSCDKIDEPLKEQEGTCGDASIQPIKKILIEDYTGHKCNNCPAAAEILHSIKEDYCDYIIPIAIHVSGFASPSGNTFINDYRTETGNELDDQSNFNVSSQGLPNGLVSRTEFNGNLVLGKDQWRAAVDTLRKMQPEVNIIINSEFDESTQKITANIKIEILQNLPYKINLGLYVTEDSIISPQKFPTGDELEYVHRHMLRKGVNGALGEEIANSVTAGDIIEKSFTIEVSEEWNINHIELVAFISKNETKEILQAENNHVQ